MEFLNQLDELGRRDFMNYTAKSMLGVSLVPALSSSLQAQQGNKRGGKKGGKAKNLIYLFMQGAMTHLDTFDLKPGHEHQGETKPIQTNVAGRRIGEHLPKLSKQFNHIAAIRSMYTETGAHEPGQYLMLTSYKKIATTRHPSIGPWAQKLLGRRNKDLPDSVLIQPQSRHPSAGFLDPSFSPLPIGDANRGLQNTKAPSYLSNKSFAKRMDLINKFDSSFRKKYKAKEVGAYTDFYTQATRLLASEEIKSFDLNQEKGSVRDKYGRNRFGQGCLLARRLIENNVRCVEVSFGSWDMHRGIYDDNTLPARTKVLDNALSALIGDLKEKGLLDETLIVVATEFGRSPKINANAGRDHHPGVFSCALAGGGIKGGRFYGKSDEEGMYPDEDEVSPADLNATIATAMGLDLNEEIFSPDGRPFKVAHDGSPVLELL
ncbi:MAG: hypothetical protein CMJ78_16855 [Planctomycetaceae bacterium]|nr:hypothetical protein [Planctomycetaceae bacterium]